LLYPKPTAGNKVERIKKDAPKHRRRKYERPMLDEVVADQSMREKRSTQSALHASETAYSVRDATSRTVV
jgi:hypothetical protein